jgi:TonB family protein
MIYAGKKEDSRTSGIITLVVHAIIFLLIFFFMSFDLPDPPPAETYAELSLADFGYSDTGSGDNEGAPTQSSAAVAEETPEEAVVDNTSEVAANVAETPSTSTQPTNANVKSAEQIKKEREEKERKEKADRIAQMMRNTGGDGNDDTGGNVGTQSGQIDGNGVFGDGGNSYSLAGRRMSGKPTFQANPTKDGRVVVTIHVNRSGKVINASVDPIQSNTTEQSLYDLAIKMAKTATFNNDPASKIQQRGTITFTFKVN